jgi:hypothetical protein
MTNRNQHEKSVFKKTMFQAPVANPSSTAQRGRGRPLPVVSVCNEEKSANVHVAAFFNPKAASCRPAANPPQLGAISPPCFSAYILFIMVCPTASKSESLPANPAMFNTLRNSARPDCIRLYRK